jgi:hypothetical protein
MGNVQKKCIVIIRNFYCKRGCRDDMVIGLTTTCVINTHKKMILELNYANLNKIIILTDNIDVMESIS